VEGFKKGCEGFGTMLQFDSVRCPIHSNNSSRYGRRALKVLQNIPDKGQLQLLLLADAVCPHKNRRFVAVCPERRCPLYPSQDTTFSCKPIHLEMRIDQHFAPLTEVLHCVGLHIRVCVLQAVKVALLILLPLLFENLNVLVWFTLVGAEQQEIGFARTLGIRNYDVRRNDGFHDDPPDASAEVWTTLNV
jgi:hypothetical protein